VVDPTHELGFYLAAVIPSRIHVIEEQQVQYVFARSYQARSLGSDHHSFGDRKCAGSDLAVPALDFNHAKAARTDWGKILVVAQRGNLDPMVRCGFQDSLSLVGLNGPAINGQFHGH
jgi:hypothetical protein